MSWLDEANEKKVLHLEGCMCTSIHNFAVKKNDHR